MSSVFGTVTNDTDTAASQAAPTPRVGQSVVLPELSQDERQRRQRIGDAWKAYRGQWGAGPLRVHAGDPDDNVRPNRCMPIVDAGISFLFGQPVKIEISNDTDAQTGDSLDVDNGAALGTSAAQAFLDDCWGDDDDKMTLLSEIAMNGAIAGHAFVLVAPANRAAGQTTPRAILLDSQNVTVITDPHDCKTVQAYWVQYEVVQRDPVQGREVRVTFRKVIARNDPDGLASDSAAGYDPDDTWMICDYVRTGGDGATGWGLTAQTPWPKPWPPIVDCQNLPNPNEYYGLSDLPDDLINLNRALIFNESNTNRIIKHHAHPTRWASGITAAQIESTPDNILLFQSADAKLNALSPATDLANAMQFGANLRADMDEQSQVPSVALGRMSELPRGQISGVTIRALYAPLMAKTIKKRRLYGKLIRLLSAHFLELGGFATAAKAKITLHWKDPMPADDLAAAQAAQAWMAIGVSADTLMMQGGYDPDTEAAKTQQENLRAMQMQVQGLAPMGADMASVPPPDASAPQSPDGTSPAPATPPPVNHPKAIRARQAAQAAAGKRVTPNGM